MDPFEELRKHAGGNNPEKAKVIALYVSVVCV